jgi:hypothetical protein
VDVLGPVPVADSPGSTARLLLRADLSIRRPLTKALKDVVVSRSARREEGVVRVRIDPADVG